MSVYKIVNKTTGELIYIGQTRNLDIRKQYHFNDCKFKKDSNLYKYICANGGWDNMEFVVLVSDSGLRNRLILENTYQLELRPMFYWLGMQTNVPNKIDIEQVIKRHEVRSRRKDIKMKKKLKIYTLVPGIVLDLTGALATPPLLAPDCALNLSKVAQFPT